MEIPLLGAKERNTLVILGAGATRGAAFVSGDALVLPPLDFDFFRVLQMSRTGRTPEGRQLVEHVRTVYGSALGVGLETVFNNLDAARVFHAAFNIKKGRVLEEPSRLIDALRVVLPALLGETIGDDCAFHAALAARLRVGDAVVSLNYDCVADRALSNHAGFRFDAERGGYRSASLVRRRSLAALRARETTSGLHPAAEVARFAELAIGLDSSAPSQQPIPRGCFWGDRSAAHE